MAVRKDALRQETSPSSHRLKDEIAATRSQMDETLDELGDRLHPRHLLDDLLELFRGSGNGARAKARAGAKRAARGARDAGESVLDAIQHNPVPAALIGAGLAWLVVDRIRDGASDGVDEPYPYGSGTQAELDPEGRALWESSGFAAGYGHAGIHQHEQHRAYDEDPEHEEHPEHDEDLEHDEPGIGERVRSGARRVAERTGSTTSRAAQRTGEAVSHAAERTRAVASRAAQRTRRGVVRARHAIGDAIDENPLLAGATALACGILAGVALPRTHREDEWMGEVSDEVKRKAVERGKQTARAGARVAERAVEATIDEAERQGITPSELAEKGKRVAQGAREAAREEGLTPEQLDEQAKSVAEATKQAAKDEVRHQKESMQQRREEERGRRG